jgi:carbon monoxide dehydrogenase subunit G
MKLEQSFEVAAPIDQVWEALIDIQRVAPCLPGAAVTDRNDDGSYNGTFTIKIGPTTAAYTGKLEMENVDPSAHVATMQAQGTDKRGQGGAKATIVSKLSPAGAGRTRVEVDTDYHITGRLARFGRGGMIEDISERLLREFAACLQSSLGQGAPSGPAVEEPSPEAASPPPTEAPAAPVTPAPPPPESEPVHGLSLVGSVLASRVRENPRPFLAVLGGLLFLRLVRRRR